jgi:TonB family protein
MEPAGDRGSRQTIPIQPRVPAQLAVSPNVSAKLSQIALSVKLPSHPLNDIQPRSVPTISQVNASIESTSTPQQAISTFAPPAETYTKLTTFPWELTQGSQTEVNLSDTDMSNLRGLFTGKVRQRIASAKYYPRTAQRRGMEGKPVIAFTLNKQGRLVKVNLAQSSGYQMLDQAALEAVQQAAPYPEIPAELKTDSYQFKLPISFVLK